MAGAREEEWAYESFNTQPSFAGELDSNSEDCVLTKKGRAKVFNAIACQGGGLITHSTLKKKKLKKKHTHKLKRHKTGV